MRSIYDNTAFRQAGRLNTEALHLLIVEHIAVGTLFDHGNTGSLFSMQNAQGHLPGQLSLCTPAVQLTTHNPVPQIGIRMRINGGRAILRYGGAGSLKRKGVSRLINDKRYQKDYAISRQVFHPL